MVIELLDASGNVVTLVETGNPAAELAHFAKMLPVTAWREYIEPLPSFDVLKSAKLQQVDAWTAAAITGGFASAATGVSARYDSEQVDQDNIKLMHAASLSAGFDTDPTYQGQVPIRAVVDGATEKTVLLHNRDQLQTLIDDMARHIGACKKRGWELQAAVCAATTAAELDEIVW